MNLPEPTAPEIVRALVVSTAHLPSPEGPAPGLLHVEPIVDATPYGWRLFVGCDEPPAAEFGEVLAPFVELARKCGALWVEFDRDGDVLEGWPVFEWESQAPASAALAALAEGPAVGGGEPWTEAQSRAWMRLHAPDQDEDAATVCDECGSPEVQASAWVIVNTDEDTGDEGPTDRVWCPTCECDDARTTELSRLAADGWPEVLP